MTRMNGKAEIYGSFIADIFCVFSFFSFTSNTRDFNQWYTLSDQIRE